MSERHPTVAYQGAPGAYSEQAVFDLFGEVPRNHCPTFRRVFDAVENGKVDFGLVPLENSQAGSINETYDLLLTHDLSVVGEVIVRVDHCLMALPGAKIDSLIEVISHPQAIAQCEEFLHGLSAAVRPEYDTAGAAKAIAEKGLVGVGAVASRRAAEIYGLEVLAEGIQTYPENFTRFGVISNDPRSLAPPDKTSLVFRVAHESGALHRCLRVFAERHLNLSKLESRPSRNQPWEYVFYVDVEAAADSPQMKSTIHELGEHTTFVEILGAYQRFKTPST